MCNKCNKAMLLRFNSILHNENCCQRHCKMKNLCKNGDTVHT